MAEYAWTDFDLAKALGGAVVGFQSETLYDWTYTGKLTETPSTEYQYAKYKTVIRGNSIYVDDSGLVKKIIGSGIAGVTVGVSLLKMPTVVLGEDSALGGDVTRSSGEGGSEGYTANVNMTTMEPRDQFAMSVLNSMLVHADHPEDFDDTTMMRFSRSAYRWAQAMMIAAADSRYGTRDDEGGGSSERTDVDVSTGTTTEKLLDNMVKAIDGLKNTVGGTLKIDNPSGDTFDIEGSGGGSSLKRDDLNDTGTAITDVIGYNSASGNAPVRATFTNLFTRMIAQITLAQKEGLNDALIAALDNDNAGDLYDLLQPLIANDFVEKGS